MTKTILEAVISLAVAIITGLLIPYIKTLISSKLTEKQQSDLSYWTNIAVAWAKQWLQSESGETKKEYVVAFLTRKFADMKITITADELDKLVEAVYSEIKEAVTSE